DTARSPALSRAAVAAAGGEVSTRWGGQPPGEGTSASEVRSHGPRRGRPQGSEGGWEAVRARRYRTFYSIDGRQMGLEDLSAARRDTTRRENPEAFLCPR